MPAKHFRAYSIWQLPSSRWKAIRAALERAVKRATAAAAAADGWRGRRQPAVAASTARSPAQSSCWAEWGTSGGQ
jgi:hypothetical protein